MMVRLQRQLLHCLRLCSLLAFASLGTVLLVRYAPGYFASADEMDAQHSEHGQALVLAQQASEGSPVQAWLHFCHGLLHGELGRSRQYDVPVRTLLLPRLRVTGKLLLLAALPAPLLALLCALPCSLLRTPALQRWAALATLAGVAVPVSVLASAALLSGLGGPIAVLLGMLAVRDFRFFSRLLRRQSKAPYLIYARACGMTHLRSICQTVLRPMWGQLLSVVTLSCVTALSALIPVEVIFGIPGAGQMAWTAAMNRDLPVLLAVTLLMALCIGFAGALQQSLQEVERVTV